MAVPLNTWVFISYFKLAYTKLEVRPSFLQLQQPLSSDVVVPVIIFFHGGSFAHSSANSSINDTLCQRLVRNNKVVVVSVNYRRAPEYWYPCAYDDGQATLRWVHSRPWLQSGKDSKAHEEYSLEVLAFGTIDVNHKNEIYDGKLSLITCPSPPSKNEV